jgi:hypothetical protein
MHIHMTRMVMMVLPPRILNTIFRNGAISGSKTAVGHQPESSSSGACTTAQPHSHPYEIFLSLGLGAAAGADPFGACSDDIGPWRQRRARSYRGWSGRLDGSGMTQMC